MEFHKWTEIENLESEKFKNSKSFQYASSIKEWVVTEKIDGTNFGLNITKDDWQLNSRNNLLGKMASFYNIYANQDMFLPLIEKVQSIMTVDQLTLQGEYFGSKVMNRIDYKVQYDFRIFGGYSVTDGVKSVIPFCDIVKLMTDCGFSDKIIPILGTYTRFEKAIEYPNNKPSTLNADVQMEGIVIMPYSIPYNADGYDLIFKNKNEDFNEMAKRGHKTPSDIPVEEIERMKALKEMFKEYITESRMYSVISKIGKPTSEKEYGKYVNPFIEDAYKDFMKDNPELLLTDKERKFITNIGSNGFLLFSIIVSKLNGDC